jgi:hypothetical protein
MVSVIDASKLRELWETTAVLADRPVRPRATSPAPPPLCTS